MLGLKTLRIKSFSFGSGTPYSGWGNQNYFKGKLEEAGVEVESFHVEDGYAVYKCGNPIPLGLRISLKRKAKKYVKYMESL